MYIKYITEQLFEQRKLLTISNKIAWVLASFSAFISSTSSADLPLKSSISSSAPIRPLCKAKVYLILV